MSITGGMSNETLAMMAAKCCKNAVRNDGKEPFIVVNRAAYDLYFVALSQNVGKERATKMVLAVIQNS